MTAIQKEVWDKMLTVQLDELYWSKKAVSISLWLKAIQFAAAILGCAALVSFFTGPEFSFLKSILGLLAAVLALILSTFDLRGALYQVEETKRKYAALYTKFEQLWMEIQLGRLPEEEILAKLNPLLEALGEVEEPKVIDSKRLKEKAFKEICNARGLREANA